MSQRTATNLSLMAYGTDLRSVTMRTQFHILDDVPLDIGTTKKSKQSH